MPQTIRFLGAAETVTGSKHLLTLNGHKVLVDCGLFQGDKELRHRNWEPLPIDIREIEAIVITHAHLDHIGYLPKLVRDGYKGPIYATKATIDLTRISLPDSGRIQEEDARFANRHNLTSHSPAQPLYTEEDAYACMKLFQPVHYHEFHPLPGKAQFQYLPAGHILGSAFAEIYFENGEKIVMSGDLGRFNTPIIQDPTTIEYGEYLVVESTYGDRFHAHEDTLGKLAEIFTRAYQQGSVVLVPSFAIGRTQELLYFINQLEEENRIPRIPIFIDSPMANSTTGVYAAAKDEYDSEIKVKLEAGEKPLHPEGVTFIRDSEASKALNVQKGPMVVIAGSGMANGGRIVHHLLHHISNSKTIVLFTGYQAQGTMGRQLLEGAKHVHIHQYDVPVHAEIEVLNSLSAHADQGEIMTWLGKFKAPPKQAFIVHGEPPAQAVLQAKIKEVLGWNVVIPKQGEEFPLP
ncbi:MAG TPA: MBL fold metallo-hydrolase [Fimbriimonadaceae bacterium]|jgi:metallo-beta-lactamase family protein